MRTTPWSLLVVPAVLMLALVGRPGDVAQDSAGVVAVAIIGSAEGTSG